MRRELTCIICPRGCALTAEGEGGLLTVSGNGCPKGKEYAVRECTAPTRTVTSTVRVSNRGDRPVSVKTASPVPKDQIFEVMRQIRAAKVLAPVAIGDMMIRDVCGTDIVATANLD